MSTIDRDLLVAKGTIDALLTLAFVQDKATTTELADEMEAAKGTARNRLTALSDAGFVSEAAELRDGTPTRVHELTADGTEVAETLNDLLSEDADPHSTAEAEPAE